MAIASIFSSFDGESFGKKVAGFLAPSPPKNQIQQLSSEQMAAAVKINDSNEEKQVDKNKTKKTEVCMRPRFAPELDGVHCFETILPY
ncbi:hypothetical protein F511_18112 [Dorcoceras hygrometricum]|uniref:Uncharacterized protein n=1 Tax=Dorcoceras hygrometricum TaxID=472368 RepID=A0A2Z7BFU5_9LAMI|nr:hypothetical protein F511_18112 [Dorcoceras hygrometricum]